MTDLTGSFWPEDQILKKEADPKHSGLHNRIWTDTKARFIQRYIRNFVYVTKKGTYLDAFAGPQKSYDFDKSWAAKLVLENRPAMIRHLALFEKNRNSVKKLETLKKQQEAEKIREKRSIHVIAGDSNLTLPKFLQDNPIPDDEPAFCLLDQRTFECAWRTVEYVAHHKKGGCKIELLYFLAAGWFDRGVSGLKKRPEEDMRTWWGREDWRRFHDLANRDRPHLLVERFKNELNYRFVAHYPIFEHKDSNRIMFYLVHASDHPDAPELMDRAYNNTLGKIVTQNVMGFLSDVAVAPKSKRKKPQKA